ncbi:integrase [Alphaproteobacteria bacterium 46_93_T64]|nr:integrase [Alphaproteobacteria bacterium 46_93_T64]
MKQARVLNSMEMKRLLAVIEAGNHPVRNRVAIMLSYLAGLRVGEIAQLKVSDIYENCTSVREQILLPAGYTKGNDARLVFVSKKLKKELTTYQSSSVFPNKPTAPLLTTQKRTSFSPNTLCQLFGERYKRAGIDGASSHSGRRSFITKMAHNGISPKVIMTLAGHKHLGTTQRYIDVNDEMLKAAVEVI